MKLFKSFARNLMIMAFSLSLVLPSLGSIKPKHSSQEADTKKILKFKPEESPAPIPIAFSELKLSDSDTKMEKSFEFNEPFISDEEWLRKLSFNIENKSGKTITHIFLQLLLPDPEGKKPFAAVIPFFSFGKPTYRPNVMPDSFLKANETIKASYLSSAYDVYKIACRKLGVNSVDRAMLVVERVMFEDDTMWSKGYLHRRSPIDNMRWDPERPKNISIQRLIPIPKNQLFKALSTPFSAPSPILAKLSGSKGLTGSTSNLLPTNAAFQSSGCRYYDGQTIRLCNFWWDIWLFCTLQTTEVTNLGTPGQPQWENVAAFQICEYDWRESYWCDFVIAPYTYACSDAINI